MSEVLSLHVPNITTKACLEIYQEDRDRTVSYDYRNPGRRFGVLSEVPLKDLMFMAGMEIPNTFEEMRSMVNLLTANYPGKVILFDFDTFVMTYMVK